MVLLLVFPETHHRGVRHGKKSGKDRAEQPVRAACLPCPCLFGLHADVARGDGRGGGLPPLRMVLLLVFLKHTTGGAAWQKSGKDRAEQPVRAACLPCPCLFGLHADVARGDGRGGGLPLLHGGDRQYGAHHPYHLGGADPLLKRGRPAAGPDPYVPGRPAGRGDRADPLFAGGKAG